MPRLPKQRPFFALVALALACALVLAGGCAKKAAKTGGGMGMGGGTGVDQSVPMGTGAIARPGTAEIGAAVETTNGVAVKTVTAPASGWLVVRSILPTGTVFGAIRVAEGRSTDVTIPVSLPDGNNVRVELRVDRGTPGVLDFDPTKAERAGDRVVVVNNKPVQRVVTLAHYGKEGPSAELSLWIDDQLLKNGNLHVRQALVPRQGWVVVRAVENGKPGRIVGLRHITYELFQFDVPIKGSPDKVWVTLHEDAGTPNRYEFAMDAWTGAKDQPLTLGGRTFSVPVFLR